MRNLKLALRTLTRTPFVTAIAALSLGLGIGAKLVGLPLAERSWPQFWLRNATPVCRLPAAAARPLLRNKHLVHLELEQSASRWSVNTVHDDGHAHLEGEEGIRALGYALERINYRGASKGIVENALKLIDDAGGTEAMVERAAQPIGSRRTQKDPALVLRYPAAVRIALELAAREHTERLALENEIALLRHEWQEAEEIASIASTLLAAFPATTSGSSPTSPERQCISESAVDMHAIAIAICLRRGFLMNCLAIVRSHR